VYAELAKDPAGRSVKELLQDSDVPEQELRETLRKLDSAGLAQRVKGTWRAVPLRGADDESTGSD
jgi:DNA-binding IscR family transcriptional regulator